MRTLTVLFLLFTISIASAQQRYDVTMKVDGIDRQFIVVKPSGAVPSGGYPVVFMFHGTSGDGERFYTISGWKEKGEQEKFITVFPSSLEYCIIDSGIQKRTTKWNNGDLVEAACPGQTLANDVLFTRMMVDTIAATFDIDRSRIYASGFSNGGLFTSKLAVEASDIFSAIAASGGSLHRLDSGAAIRNIPVIFTLGSLDDRYTTPLGVSELPVNDSILTTVGFMLNRYLRAFSLTNDYVKATTPLTLSYTFTTPVPGTDATRFTFVLIDGMHHIYPNGSNHPLSSADHFWTFFNNATSSVEAPSVDSDASVFVYPNPANTHIRVSNAAGVHITLRTTLGENVFDATLDDNGSTPLPSLPSGLYFVEIRDGNSVSVKTVVIQR